MKFAVKMKPKDILIMLLVMMVILCLYLYFSGFFHVNSSLRDVLSLSKGQVVAESENWKLCVPEDSQAKPYILYSERDGILPYVAGFLYLEGEEGGEAEKREIDGVHWYDRHFFIGTKRWVVWGDLEGRKILKYYLKIQWEPVPAYGKEPENVAVEYMISDGITPEEREEAEIWLADKGYRRPFGYPLMR